MPERVLDVLAEDREEEHVAEDVVPAAVHEHRGEPADPPRLGAPAGVVDGARVERRVVDGRFEVRQLVEDPDREVGRDQRDVDDREPSRVESVGERQHRDPPSARRGSRALPAASRRGPSQPCRGVRLRPFERLRLEERLGEGVEPLAVVGEQLHRLVVRLADDAAHLVVDPLPRPLGDLRDAGHQGGAVAVLRQDGEEADRVAHAEAADHVAGELGRLADVGLGAGRLVAVDDLLGGAPAGRDLDVGEQALPCRS